MRAKSAALSPDRGHEATVVLQERSMSDTIIETAAPEGAATRHDVEAALRGRGSASMRFMGWNMTEADLNGLDLQGCEFVRCRAGHANFSSCNFTEARFLFCDFNNYQMARDNRIVRLLPGLQADGRPDGGREHAHVAGVREMSADQRKFARAFVPTSAIGRR